MGRPETQLTDIKKRQDRYLAARLKKGTLTGACKSARVSHNTVYDWRDNDQEGGYAAEEFRILEKRAADMFADLLEEEAVRRARDGTLKPVYQGGQLVGKVREYSDTLLIFLLKGNRPEKYRERQPDGGDQNNGDKLDELLTRMEAAASAAVQPKTS